MKQLIPMRLMTADEIQIVQRMHSVTFPVASWDKRFFRSVSSGQMITENQSKQLWRIFVKYRRQMSFPDKARLLAAAETLAAPDLRKINAQSEAQAKIDALRQQFKEETKPHDH